MSMDDQVDDTPCFFHEATFTDHKGELKTTKIPVVQELSRHHLTHFPKRFIAIQPPPPADHQPQTPPVIDMERLRAGGDHRTSELRGLADAGREWGLFLIRNHGIEDVVLEDVKEVVKGFFGLSFEEKKANVGSYASVDNMGYGKNFVKSEEQPLDWIDRLSMKIAPFDQQTQGLSVWPRKPANFREAVEKYVEKSRRILDELLQDLAESISLDTTAFTQFYEAKESEIKVRVNCYPPCPRPDLSVGIMPHSDASGLTILMEFGGSGGLQVQRGTDWTTLHWPNDNSLLMISFGDLLEIMSNGLLRSPWHRVQTQIDVERFSLVYFYNPSAEIEIGPVTGDNYKKVIVKDYISNYYKITPTISKDALKFVQSKKA